MASSFWTHLNSLVTQNKIVLDRPKGSHHPRYPDLVYPLDYGYLDGTTAADGGGIDVWIGSQPERNITGIVATVDLVKSDAEIKILLGCTEEDIQTILDFHNNDKMGGFFVRNPKE
jgi:inorganic pyrophosphatase